MKGLKKSGVIMMIVSALTLTVTAEVVDRIVAVVNKTVITEFQIQQTQRKFLEEGAPEAALKHDAVLNFLIEQELVLQEAQNKGIVVTDEELNNALENIKQQNKLTSDEDLKQALASQGMIWTEFLSDIRKQIQLAKTVGQEVRAKVSMADAEVDAYYQEHQEEFARPAAESGALVRQILLTVPENADAAQIEQIQLEAEALVKQLRDGADFAEMARIHSQHASAVSGGELGTFQPGQLAAPFDIAFSLQSGAISDPIRSDKGFHIITVQKASSGEPEDVLRIKAQIREALFDKKAQQQYTEWIATLKDKAYIELK